jgi:hypothetical protein
MFMRLDNWHKTKSGLLVFGLVELGLGYIFASWAINDGNLFDWLLTIVLLVGGIQNLGKLGLRGLKHGR